MNNNILNQEDIQFLKELAQELKTQDNCATAYPIYYEIAEPYFEWGIDNNYGWDKTQIMLNYLKEEAQELLINKQIKQKQSTLLGYISGLINKDL